MARESDAEFIARARKRFDLAMDATRSQREREIEDLKYFAGDQWSKADLDARAAQQASGTMPPVAARPAMVINLLRESVKQVENQERSSELGIELVPADDFAELTGGQDDTEIELREGLVRRIQRESEANDARSWAFRRAVQCGTGYYGVMTRFLPGKSWDQEVYVQRYYNQSGVLLDPAHEQPDGSDAEWGFVGTDVWWEMYKARWPKLANGRRNDATAATDDEWRALGAEAPGWFRMEGKDLRIVRVTDYWYKEHEARTLCLLPDGSSAWDDELPENMPVVERRTVDDITVKWCQMDGLNILDETDWPGQDIPIVKVLGEELQPYDQERRSEGMVRPARSSQAGFNAMVSKWVESVGYAPIPPFQATPDQVEGFEPWYQVANTRALPYLPYNLVSDGGKPLGPPTRTPVETPIAAIAASVQLFREAIQSTTGIHDPQLGKIDPSLKSGRAIRFLQEQSQQGTSNFLDNLRRSIRYEGQILNGLLEPIYGRKAGRLLRIVNGENDAQTVRIDSSTEAGTSLHGSVGMPPMGQSASSEKVYRLTPDCKCNVIVKVTKSFDSLRSETAAMLGDMISSNPVFMTWFGDKFMENTDIPGHKQIAERVKVMLDPKIQQMLMQKEQSQGQQIPPALQSQLMQMQQRLQEAEQVMHAQQQELSTRQADAKIKLQIAELGADKDIKLQTMRNASALAVAKINALTKGVISDNESAVEAVALAAEQDRTAAQVAHETHTQARDHVHEHVQSQLDRQHEAQTQAMSQAHQSASAEIQLGANAAEADAQREHEIALQPEPDAESETESV